jgi:hypothetical protein
MILQRLELDPIDNLTVHYPTDYLPVDTSRETLMEDIKLGIKTPIDELLKLDHTLDEIEAEAQVRANLEFNNSLNANKTQSVDKAEDNNEAQNEEGGLDVRRE